VPKITGGKAASARIKAISSDEGKRRLGQALFAAGQAIQIEAQISITEGAVSGKNHVPSRPGEPPNQDTGVLANNIETVQTGPLTVEVSSNAPYAAALEYGTSKMAARPYMARAVARKRGEIPAMIRDAIDIIIKSEGGVRGNR
jgi:HK97 gp10 family phage protein